MKLHPFFYRPKRYRLRWSCSAANGARTNNKAKRKEKTPLYSLSWSYRGYVLCHNQKAETRHRGRCGAGRPERRWESEKMTGNEYQFLAARTINYELTDKGKEMHALHGMVSEIGELHGLYQKQYQGHEMDPRHAQKELGDLLWFIAEWCTSYGLSLEDIMQMNIDKLQARYPEGFDAEHSLHREPGDI